jgi:hypothetical protein
VCVCVFVCVCARVCGCRVGHGWAVGWVGSDLCVCWGGGSAGWVGGWAVCVGAGATQAGGECAGARSTHLRHLPAHAPSQGAAHAAHSTPRLCRPAVFSFARNPWSRAISSYRYNNKRAIEPECHAPFTSFAAAPPLAGALCYRKYGSCCKERYGFVLEHIEAQTPSCLFTEDGQPAVDFLGRSERFDDDFQASGGGASRSASRSAGMGGALMPANSLLPARPLLGRVRDGGMAARRAGRACPGGTAAAKERRGSVCGRRACATVLPAGFD